MLTFKLFNHTELIADFCTQQQSSSYPRPIINDDEATSCGGKRNCNELQHPLSTADYYYYIILYRITSL